MRLGTLPVSCDNFRPQQGVSLYFLSHFHTDHLKGLSNTWNHGVIVCSRITRALLLTHFVGFPPHRVVVFDHNSNDSTSSPEEDDYRGGVVIPLSGALAAVAAIARELQQQSRSSDDAGDSGGIGAAVITLGQVARKCRRLFYGGEQEDYTTTPRHTHAEGSKKVPAMTLSLRVRCFDANHIPGSLMFFFEECGSSCSTTSSRTLPATAKSGSFIHRSNNSRSSRSSNSFLYTGDFRFSPEKFKHWIVKEDDEGRTNQQQQLSTITASSSARHQHIIPAFRLLLQRLEGKEDTTVLSVDDRDTSKNDSKPLSKPMVKLQNVVDHLIVDDTWLHLSDNVHFLTLKELLGAFASVKATVEYRCCDAERLKSTVLQVANAPETDPQLQHLFAHRRFDLEPEFEVRCFLHNHFGKENILQILAKQLNAIILLDDRRFRMIEAIAYAQQQQEQQGGEEEGDDIPPSPYSLLDEDSLLALTNRIDISLFAPASRFGVKWRTTTVTEGDEKSSHYMSQTQNLEFELTLPRRIIRVVSRRDEVSAESLQASQNQNPFLPLFGIVMSGWAGIISKKKKDLFGGKSTQKHMTEHQTEEENQEEDVDEVGVENTAMTTTTTTGGGSSPPGSDQQPISSHSVSINPSTTAALPNNRKNTTTDPLELLLPGYQPPQIIRWELPYSLHCTPVELKTFVAAIRPKSLTSLNYHGSGVASNASTSASSTSAASSGVLPQPNGRSALQQTRAHFNVARRAALMVKLGKYLLQPGYNDKSSAAAGDNNNSVAGDQQNGISRLDHLKSVYNQNEIENANLKWLERRRALRSSGGRDDKSEEEAAEEEGPSGQPRVLGDEYLDENADMMNRRHHKKKKNPLLAIGGRQVGVKIGRQWRPKNEPGGDSSDESSPSSVATSDDEDCIMPSSQLLQSFFSSSEGSLTFPSSDVIMATVAAAAEEVQASGKDEEDEDNAFQAMLESMMEANNQDKSAAALVEEEDGEEEDGDEGDVLLHLSDDELVAEEKNDENNVMYDSDETQDNDEEATALLGLEQQQQVMMNINNEDDDIIIMNSNTKNSEHDARTTGTKAAVPAQIMNNDIDDNDDLSGLCSDLLFTPPPPVCSQEPISTQ